MISEEDIRKRSYEIWQRKGCPKGGERENWAEAVAELEAELRETGLRIHNGDNAPKVPARPHVTERPKPRDG